MGSDFVEHLEELRRRIILCLIALLAASVAAYCFSSQLLDFLIAPLKRFGHAELYFHKPYEAFLTHLKVAAVTGFMASTPVIFTQAWNFVAPGLYERERKIVFPLTLVSIVLFLTGAFFAYAVVTPVGLQFLLSFQTEGLRPLIGIAAYFNFLTGMMIAFGILFDFPVVLIGLVKIGAVSTHTLARFRKFWILAIFITAAVLTPSPDPVSQLLLALPLWLLFEISLVIARRIESRKLPPGVVEVKAEAAGPSR